MKKLLLAASAAGMASFSSQTAAFCYAPTPPTVFISKPHKPYCATNRTCSQWEVDSYKRDIDRYFRQLEEYLEAVNKYRRDAVEYAQCMAKDLD